MMSLSSCHEDSFEEEIVVSGLFEPEQIVLSQVEGIVIDTSGTVLRDAQVIIGNMSATTDNNGRFLLFDVPIADNGTVISAHRSGYIENATRIFPKDDLLHEVTIVLIAKPPIRGISGEMGGTLFANSGVEIDIAPMSFLKDGSPYLGEVSTGIYRPESTGTSPFPLGLQIHEVIDIDNDLEISTLSSVSMAFIEFTDDQGNDLEVAADNPIQVTFSVSDIPNSLVGDTPELLSYDPSLGYWSVVGTANGANQSFSAEATQFNWLAIGSTRRAVPYCFDFGSATPDDTEDLSYALSQEDGSIVSFGPVTLNNTECFTAEASGQLTLKVFSKCGEETFSRTIATPSTESSTERINLDQATDMITIRGSLQTCDGSALPANTIISYSSASGDVEIDGAQGDFEIVLDPCDGDEGLLITAMDNNGIIALSEVKLGDTARNIEVLLQVCEAANTLILDNEVFSNAFARQARSETLIVADDENGQFGGILIGFEAFTEGEFRANLFSPDFSDLCLGTVNILEYGEVGELIIGTYCSDEEQSGIANCRYTSGSFRVIREE